MKCLYYVFVDVKCNWFTKNYIFFSKTNENILKVFKQNRNLY